MQTRTLLKLSLAMLASVGIGVATLASFHAQAQTGGKPPSADYSTEKAPIRPTDVQLNVLSWGPPATSGDCLEQGGATLSLRSDGQAVWSSQVSSTSSNDSFCHDLQLVDRNGTVLWNWGRFCSPTLSSTPQHWIANLNFPEYVYQYVVNGLRENHC
jgi:predicted ribosomally synthesized peptide with SipW-like signal peptide